MRKLLKFLNPYADRLISFNLLLLLTATEPSQEVWEDSPKEMRTDRETSGRGRVGPDEPSPSLTGKIVSYGYKIDQASRVRP